MYKLPPRSKTLSNSLAQTCADIINSLKRTDNNVDPYRANNPGDDLTNDHNDSDGDGMYQGTFGQYPAYIGKGDLGTLEVEPQGAACCKGADYLFINPPKGSPIPSGCQGSGEW